MIVIESKRKKVENILKKYPGAIIADVTSHATDALVRLSPFYPHGDIPVPYTNGLVKASCVEGIWQGLKVFENEDIDESCFSNTSMQGIKRTTRKHGKILGHKRGPNGKNDNLLTYLEARKNIYFPTYRWMIEHHALNIITRLREADKGGKIIVLLDYNTSCDPNDISKPLSHAYLIRAYAQGEYPYSDVKKIIKKTLTNGRKDFVVKEEIFIEIPHNKEEDNLNRQLFLPFDYEF